MLICTVILIWRENNNSCQRVNRTPDKSHLELGSRRCKHLVWSAGLAVAV